MRVCAGTDINAVARSARGAPVNERLEGGGDAIFHARRPRPPTKQESADGVPGAHVIATADDFSLIKLFNGPVVADDAPYRAYRGHASHVMCVRFSHDDRRLFSVGGIDRCVFQWRTVGVNGEDAAVDAHVLNAVEEAALRKHQVRVWAAPPRPYHDRFCCLPLCGCLLIGLHVRCMIHLILCARKRARSDCFGYTVLGVCQSS